MWQGNKKPIISGQPDSGLPPLYVLPHYPTRGEKYCILLSQYVAISPWLSRHRPRRVSDMVSLQLPNCTTPELAQSSDTANPQRRSMMKGLDIVSCMRTRSLRDLIMRQNGFILVTLIPDILPVGRHLIGKGWLSVNSFIKWALYMRTAVLWKCAKRAFPAVAYR